MPADVRRRRHSRGYRVDDQGHLLTDRGSVKEIRTFRLRGLFVSRFERYRDIYITKLRQLLLHFLRFNMALNLLSLAGVASIWAYAVFQAVLARITIGDLALVFQAAQNSRSSLSALISSGGQVYENALFATRFFDLMDLDPQSIEGALSPPRTQTPARLPRPMERGIEFRDVSFKYPASDARILERVSFTIPAGKKTAIVGENGAGKTTLVKLLSRLYDPSEGSVLLDGRDLRDYDLQDYRRNVSVVYQDFFRYDMSASTPLTSDRSWRPPPRRPAPMTSSVGCPTATKRFSARPSTKASISPEASGSTSRLPAPS